MHVTKSVVIGTVPSVVQGILALNTSAFGTALSATIASVDRAAESLVSAGVISPYDWTNSQIRRDLLGVKSVADVVGTMRDPSNPSNEEDEGTSCSKSRCYIVDHACYTNATCHAHWHYCLLMPAMYAAGDNVGKKLAAFAQEFMPALGKDFSSDTWSKLEDGCNDLFLRVTQVPFKGNYPSRCRVSENGLNFW